jgi:DNA helicase-2/ATP-dependent DNA helicase PcrA
MLWGSLKFNGPSQFLHEIPSAYYKWLSYQTTKKDRFVDSQFDDFNQSHDYHDDAFSSDKVYQTKKIKSPSNYPTGSKLLHALYGEGMVLDSEGVGSDEKVTILFADGIKKKFMVKFAPLQKL